MTSLLSPRERRMMLTKPAPEGRNAMNTNHRALAKSRARNRQASWEPKIMSRKDPNLGKVTVYANGFKLGTLTDLHDWRYYPLVLPMLRQGKLSEQLVEACEEAWGTAFASGTLSINDMTAVWADTEDEDELGGREGEEGGEKGVRSPGDRGASSPAPGSKLPKSFSLWQPNPAISFMSNHVKEKVVSSHARASPTCAGDDKDDTDDTVTLQLVTFPRQRVNYTFSRNFTVGELYTHIMLMTGQYKFGLFWGFPHNLLTDLDATLYDSGLNGFGVVQRVPEQFPNPYRHVWQDEEDD